MKQKPTISSLTRKLKELKKENLDLLCKENTYEYTMCLTLFRLLSFFGYLSADEIRGIEKFAILLDTYVTNKEGVTSRKYRNHNSIHREDIDTFNNFMAGIKKDTTYLANFGNANELLRLAKIMFIDPVQKRQSN